MLRRAFQALVACRYLIFVAIGTVRFLQVRADLHGNAPGDWHLFAILADTFAVHPLHAFAAVRSLPTGPLTAPLAVPLHQLGSNGGWQGTRVFLMVLSLVVIRVAEVAALRLEVARPDRVRATVLVGGSLLVLGWVGPSLEYAHIDDVFALVAMTVAVLLCMEQRWVAVAVAVGIAAAFKPWGFFLLPLTAVRDRLRLRGPLLALAVGLVLWVPFVIADRHTLDASHFFIGVGHSSSLRVFGLPLHAKEPWIRSLQFIVAIGLGAIAVRRGRWWLAFWLVFATRINLEPGAFGYYSAGPLVGAFVADMVRPGRVYAGRTATTWSLLYGVGGLAAHLGAGGLSLDVVKIAARLALPLIVLVEVFRPRRDDELPIRTADPHAAKNSSTS